MFQGSFVAIVTPFKNGEVDYDSLEKLINFQIENGSSGIVPCGTTGESATLSHEEHESVIRFTIKTVNKRVPVIAGAGSNNTKEALRLTKAAKQMGADAVLLISPYYNKPSQKGIYEHFKLINDSVDIPIVLYNVPGRTSKNMEAATTVELSKLKNIVGIKEASGDLNQISEIIRDAASDFVVLSGDDAMAYPIVAIGGKGVISVTANIMPKEMAMLMDYSLKGDQVEAKKLHLKLLEISNQMFMDSNPIPVKEALALMGLIEAELRLPMIRLADAQMPILKELLKKYKLI